jgi:hypothetical protein
METAGSISLISSSTNLFHSLQEGHLPSHFSDWCPQFWQKNWVFAFFTRAGLLEF